MDAIDLDLLNLIEVSIYVLDAVDGKIPTYSAINDYGCKSAGRAREDFVGKTAKEAFPGKIGAAAYRRHQQAIRSGYKTSYEIPLLLNGKERLVATTLSPIADATGAVTKLIGVAIVKDPEHSGEIADLDGQVLPNETEQFISLAAHDLRSPMRNVKFLAEMILEDFKDFGDGKLQMVQTMEKIASNSMMMISQLLALADSTAAKVDHAAFEIGAMCSDILITLDPTTNHKVHSNTAAVLADKAAFQIVLRNLIDNAIKHCGHDQVEISIVAAPRDDGFVEVLLMDDGVGFADPTIAFFDNGELKVDSGFGLLGIRRLIEARGGSISAERSELCGGGIVRFALPGSMQIAA